MRVRSVLPIFLLMSAPAFAQDPNVNPPNLTPPAAASMPTRPAQPQPSALKPQQWSADEKADSARLSIRPSATPYSTPEFDAVFGGVARPANPLQNNLGTGTGIEYECSFGPVEQMVVVRPVEHDIAVNTVSSDFYANSIMSFFKGAQINMSHSAYQGHPLTYLAWEYSQDGLKMTARGRFIVASPTKVVFIEMAYPSLYEGAETQKEWERFESSLNIK